MHDLSGKRSAPPLEACGLRRDYGEVRALKGVDLRVDAGRIVALLGPNGSGKTTLLNCWAGLLEPTAGDALVFGEPARAMRRETRAQVASMIDGQEPPSWARVGDMLSLQEEASASFDRAFAEAFCFGRGKSPSDRYGRLSKGQKRWALAGLTLGASAEIMLLDEPADGLDPEARRRLYDALRDRVDASGSTAVVSTHVLADVERVADEAAVLAGGRIVLHADLEELRETCFRVEVREESSPAEQSALCFAERVRQAAGLEEWIVRCMEGREALEGVLGEDGRVVGGVDLESLYLALVRREEGGVRL